MFKILEDFLTFLYVKKFQFELKSFFELKERYAKYF